MPLLVWDSAGDGLVIVVLRETLLDCGSSSQGVVDSCAVIASVDDANGRRTPEISSSEYPLSMIERSGRLYLLSSKLVCLLTPLLGSFRCDGHQLIQYGKLDLVFESVREVLQWIRSARVVQKDEDDNE